MAKRVPHLVQKGHSYYFRIRVPAPLVASFGRKEVTEALGRVSHPQAATMARELGAHYQGHFQRLLHVLGHEPTAPLAPALPKRSPTLEEVTFVAREGARELLSTDEQMRSLGMNSDGGDAWTAVLLDLDDEVSEAISGTKLGQLKGRFKADIEAHGLTLPDDRDELRQMLYRWATEYGSALRKVQSRVKGEPVDTPAPQEPPSSLSEQRHGAITEPSRKPASQLKLRDVFELWKAHEKDRPPKTVGAAELAVKRWEEMTGNPVLSTLKRADGSEFRQKLMASEMSEHGTNKLLTWVHVLLNFEVNNYQRIAANPWKGINIAVKSKTIREDWKDAQVVKLFGHPVWQRYEVPKVRNAGLDAAYWCPIIGAFTGARATEIAQLLPADILQVAGLWCIRFEITEPWQKLKKASSARTIPMHPELFRLGLVDFAEAMRKRGALRLFPALSVSSNNNAGGPISSWFSDHKSAEGFGPENTFHGWRNTIETKLQRVREGQLYIDRYIGHKPEGMGAGGYARVYPADLVKTAGSITYPELVLPRVYVKPVWRPLSTPIQRT